LQQQAIAQIAVYLLDISTTFSVTGAKLYRFLATKKLDFAGLDRYPNATNVGRNTDKTRRCKFILRGVYRV